MATDDDKTGTVIAVGAIGGGAMLLWWLLRGRGVGGGGDRGGQGAPSARAVPSSAAEPAEPPCRVFLRGTEIELNGVASDLAATVATCRAAGTAHPRASGDTTAGTVMQMARALNAAGVATLADGDIAETVRDALTRMV